MSKSAGDAALDALRDLFRYHEWATLTLVDRCRSLTAEQLSQSAPGTRGAILDTLVHLVAADQRYQRRFGVNPDPVVREDAGATLDVLDKAISRQAAGWQAIVNGLDDYDITIEAEPRNDWPEAPHSQNLLLLQAIHHGNDHRTHICTILGSLDLEVPEIDGWSYWSAERVAR